MLSKLTNSLSENKKILLLGGVVVSGFALML